MKKKNQVQEELAAYALMSIEQDRRAFGKGWSPNQMQEAFLNAAIRLQRNGSVFR